MSRLSFQEKMLYAQFVCLLLVGVYYAHFLVYAPPGHHFLHAVILGVSLLLGAFAMILRRRSGSTVDDERDRAIAAIGDRWSNLTLWIGLVILMVVYWDHGGLQSGHLIIGLIFHLLLLAGLVRIVRELIAYRMAA